MQFLRGWHWQTDRKETILIFISIALFWTLMFSPPLSNLRGEFLIIGMLEGLLLTPADTAETFEDIWVVWLKHDWDYALEMTFRMLLRLGVLLCFRFGLMLAISLPLWLLIRSRLRLFLWDFLGLLGLIGLLLGITAMWLSFSAAPSPS